jgi:drug/metabolite transporter (DMT)-like permease
MEALVCVVGWPDGETSTEACQLAEARALYGGTVLAVLGGVGAALAWAVSTLCSSRSSRMIAPTAVVAWVMVFGLIITAPIAAANGIPRHLITASGIWLLVGGGGNVLGLMLVYRALRIGKVALVSPITSTEGAIAAVIAVIAGESLALDVALTLVVIVFGVCLAAVPSDALGHTDRLAHPRAVAFAVAAACSFGISLYGTGRAGAVFPSAWVVLSARLIGALIIATPLALRGRLELTRRALPLVVGSGIAEVVGFFSYTDASRHGIAIASVLSSQFAAVAALGAFLLFKERLSRLQLLGVVVVVCGVGVLSALTA